MENPKIRIESDGQYTQVWVDGEKISDRACMIDFRFYAEPNEVYCETEEYVKDKDGKNIIKNDEVLRERVVILDTTKKGNAE